VKYWLNQLKVKLTLFLVAESGSGDVAFIMRLRDLWHVQWYVDVHSEISVSSLYGQLQQLEHAKQSQQSPTQVLQDLFCHCTSLSKVEVFGFVCLKTLYTFDTWIWI